MKNQKGSIYKFTIHSQHRLQIISHLERSRSLAADLIDRDPVGELGQRQAFSRADVEDGQIGDDLPHAAGAGQGECAVGQNLGVALLVDVFLGVRLVNHPRDIYV